jgi:Protein of unknown function (DUF2569)
MKETLQEIIAWGYPLVESILIVFAATRKRFPGKPWLLAYLAIGLATGLAWRLPSLLLKFDTLDFDVSRFYDLYGLPLSIIAFVGYCMLIPFLLAVANPHLHQPGDETMAGQAETDDAHVSTLDPSLAGIGGWLVLPAIGFVLGPIIGIVMLVVAVGLYGDVADAGLGGLYALELLVDVGLLAFLIYAATRFFGKMRNAPPTIIALLIAGLVSSGVLIIIELSAGAEPFAIESGKQLVRSIIAAGIWIPYFKVSKRVKATFVH